jgi:hypothetical protein
VRFEEAADVMARLPNDRVPGLYGLWPRIVSATVTSGRPAAPSPKAIDRMDEVVGWLCWLEPEERRLVWLRRRGCLGSGSPRLGIGRTTAWQRWTMALLEVASRLNAAAEQSRPNIKPLKRWSDSLVEKGSLRRGPGRRLPVTREDEPARHGRGGLYVLRSRRCP